MTEIVTNDNKLHVSCMSVACQLHSDWLQTIRFLIVASPNSSIDSNVSPKVKTMEEKIIWACFLTHNI